MTRPPVPRLHVLTTEGRSADASLAFVDTVLSAGAPCIQVRAKGLADRAWHGLAAAVTARCHDAGALCIVNDRVDLALAVGADGVHLGADDLPVAAARRIAGDRLLVGTTARDPAQAVRAASDGADYLGVGPVFATRSKDGLPDPIGIDGVGAVAAAVDLPVIAIAGVTAVSVPSLLEAGCHGVAVMGAVGGADDPAAAAREFLDRLAAHRQARS